MRDRNPIRVVVWGLDPIGLAMAQLVWRRSGLEPVGAICSSPARVGQDLGHLIGFGEHFGVTVHQDPAEVLNTSRPDVTLIASGSSVDEVGPNILQAMEAGSNVICFAPEMTYPWATRSDLAESLDELAHAHGVTVLGTGVNPGFVMDTLVLALTGCCMDVDRIRASRSVDLAPLGEQVARSYGVGMSPSEFSEAEKRGRIAPHSGLEQSIHLVADALGWTLEKVEHDRRPILAESRLQMGGLRVDPGQVAGCLDAAIGYVDGLARIVLEHPQTVIGVDTKVIQTGDIIEIEGKPSIRMAIQPEIAALEGSAAIAVNMIPAVLLSGPGVKTMADMPLPRAVLGDLRDMMDMRGPTVEEELARGWHEKGLGGHEEGVTGFPGETL